MYRVLLRGLDGNDAGEFQTSTLAWAVGDTFATGDGRRLRIVDRLPVPDSDDVRLVGAWLVEPADAAL